MNVVAESHHVIKCTQSVLEQVVFFTVEVLLFYEQGARENNKQLQASNHKLYCIQVTNHYIRLLLEKKLKILFLYTKEYHILSVRGVVNNLLLTPQ